MSNPKIAEDLRRRLLRKGLGRSYARRAARELRDHWDELVEEGLRQNLDLADAENQATHRLGEAETLAEALCARMQQTSWLGRHPALGFALFPIVANFVWWAICIGIFSAATGLLTWNPQTSGTPEPNLDLLQACSGWIRIGSFVVIPMVSCHVAQRYFCGWQAALWACLVLAIHNAFHKFQIQSGPPGHGSVTWMYAAGTAGVPLLPILAPLTIFAIYWLWNLRAENLNLQEPAFS